MRVFTARVCQKKRIKNHLVEYVDTTVKSGGGSPFAPTWDMVMAHKRGEITNRQYTDLYMARMKESIKNRYPEWIAFCQKELVAVTCYCAPHAFCHRKLLVMVLRDFCAEHHVEFSYGGEIDLSIDDPKFYEAIPH